MSALIVRPARSGPLFGRHVAPPRSQPMLRPQDEDPCGGERIIDFALCLVVAAAIVGLLLLAL